MDIYIPDTHGQNGPKRNKLVKNLQPSNKTELSYQFSYLYFRCGVNTTPESPSGYEKACAVIQTTICCTRKAHIAVPCCF